MTSIDDCRELGLLPEEVVAYLSETSYWSRSQEDDNALEALAAALLEQTNENIRLAKAGNGLIKSLDASEARADEAERMLTILKQKWPGIYRDLARRSGGEA